MTHCFGLVGAPSSAGAHTPGLEQAPAAVRKAGLVELLRAAGAEVDDAGDVPGFRWRPDPARPRAQNAAAVARVAGDVAEVVAEVWSRARTPLVVGGDCTVTVGVVAGLARAGIRPGLVYLDGGPDLYTPLSRVNGNLDAMGLAHALNLPGCLPELAQLGPTVPLLSPDEVVAFGDSLPEDDYERRLLGALGIAHVPAGLVHTDAVGAARTARTWIEAAVPAFVLHLDVDVLAFAEAPLADVPEPAGLSLAELGEVVAVLAGSPRFAGLVVTEINPDHLPDPETLPQFLAVLATALGGPAAGHSRGQADAVRDLPQDPARP